MDLSLLMTSYTIVIILEKSVGGREFEEGPKETPESMELYNKIKNKIKKNEKESIHCKLSDLEKASACPFLHL